MTENYKIIKNNIYLYTEIKTAGTPVYKVIFHYVLLIVSALVWGLGHYPRFSFIRFFGLIPFLYIIMYDRHYLQKAVIFGWVAYIINFYWLYLTFRISGKLPLFYSILVPALLCLYYGFQYFLIALLNKLFCTFNKKLLYFFPFLFVFVDFLYPKLFTHSIADGLIGINYVIQIIDLAGMTGLILVVMYCNIGLFVLIEKIRKRENISIYNFAFIFLLVITLGYGIFRVKYFENLQVDMNKTYAAMIQGNITGKQKMDTKNFFQINIDRYNNLTKEAVEKYSPDFIIWPESVFNRAYDGSATMMNRLIHDDYPPLILGSTFWKRLPDDEYDITNSSFLIEKRTEIARYDKQHLLAFGEYVPMEKYFPFLNSLTPLNYSMRSGDTSSVFTIGKNVKACISICYEDIFPNEIRRKVNEGSNLMINITNDSWYGDTIGPVHHSVLGRLRAIENRRAFYRCTATGVTTASDLTGKVVATGPVWVPYIIPATLPLYEGRSLYSYIGESLSYFCVGLVLIILLLTFSDYIEKKYECEYCPGRVSIFKLQRKLVKLHNRNRPRRRLRRRRSVKKSVYRKLAEFMILPGIFVINIFKNIR